MAGARSKASGTVIGPFGWLCISQRWRRHSGCGGAGVSKPTGMFETVREVEANEAAYERYLSAATTLWDQLRKAAEAFLSGRDARGGASRLSAGR